MIHEVLPPGVEDADHSYPCTEMPGITGECHERFGDRTEKKIVQDLLVHGDEGIQCRGDGEDHMEVRNRQEILTARLDPLLFPQGLALGAVAVPAGVIRYLQMAAGITSVPVAAQDGSPAHLDGAHDPPLRTGQPMGCSVRRTVLTEDVRHLGAGCSHPRYEAALSRGEVTCARFKRLTWR